MSSALFTDPGITGAATETIAALVFANIAATAAEDLKFEQADAGEKCFGITSSGVSSGEHVVVHHSGIGRLTVDGSGTAIVAGDRLKAASGGVGVKTVTDRDEYGAIALEPATTSGAVIRVKIISGQISAA